MNVLKRIWEFLFGKKEEPKQEKTVDIGLEAYINNVEVKEAKTPVITETLTETVNEQIEVISPVVEIKTVEVVPMAPTVFESIVPVESEVKPKRKYTKKAPEKKATAKKAPEKKATAKKAPAKKAPAKKVATKKAPTKKKPTKKTKK